MVEINNFVQQMEKPLKPIFNKRIFWDVNFEALDYDAKANFIIERVMRW